MRLPIQYISQQPVDDFGFRFTDFKYSATITANTDTTFIIPGAAKRWKAVIKTNAAGVWVCVNATAAIPAGNTFALTTSELILSNTALCREVVTGDILHFFQTAGGAAVSIVLYSVL